jgi:class 3 adenylate cyclase
MARISAQELAELVPCSLENVQRLDDLRLLDPDESGLYPSSDVHVVRLMAAFEEAGISLQDVARAVERGALTFPMGMFMPEPVALSETYESLGERLGRSPDLLRRLSSELGLPPPPDDRVRAEDAELLSLMMTRLDIADDDELSRFARLYGGSVQRLVASGLQFFDSAVRQRVETYDLSDEERDAIMYRHAGGYTELVGRAVPLLQQRHREYAVLDYIVNVTETFLEERGVTPRNPRIPPAIAFLDLSGYTETVEERGDEVAAEVAAGLASIVQESAQAHGGRPVKWLGDGVMFHFTTPAAAIRSGLELVERTEATVALPARIGINAGTVIAQEGDYFGRTVNVAARIADYARPREVLVSEAARQSTDGDDLAFELVGDVDLKGVAKPVRIHRVTRAA